MKSMLSGSLLLWALLLAYPTVDAAVHRFPTAFVPSATKTTTTRTLSHRAALPRTTLTLTPTTTTSKLAASTTAQDTETDAPSSSNKKTKTPIILLAGFLGTGKTSALKHLLENTEGAKIGVIVNDVASVNIDAKLVSSMPGSAGGDMIELQNGCACCSLSDELFTSVETLFQPKTKGLLKRVYKQEEKRHYDAIVIELSGVADPMAIAATWKAAASSATQPVPAVDLAEIKKIVTMIDSCTFGVDYMTWDAAMERPGWVEATDDCAGHRKVAELLCEQVEAANLILVNKIDLATKEEVQIASQVARALNDKAVLHEVEFGKITPQEILELGTNGVKTGPMENGQEQEEPVEETSSSSSSSSSSHAHDHDCEEPDCTDNSHSHAHDHDCEEPDCEEPDCTDSSHSHAHDHGCEEPDCTDSSHSHAHDHDCEEPDCADSSHEHSHSHDASCDDADCTDSSHSHSHNHATSTDNLGIVNFVYKSSRPFDTNRLMAVLNTWPVPIKDTLDIKVLQEAQDEGYAMSDGKSTQDSPFVGVLRSKGFCWLAPTKWSGANWDAYRHDTAMYWSHAGKHFGLSSNGKWWGSIQLYDGWEKYMKNVFQDNMAEYDRILREDFVSEEFGDRRQELVFIGTNLDQTAITKALDDCILTDDELDTYRQKLKNYQDTVLSEEGGKGLFDMDGAVEHTETQ